MGNYVADVWLGFKIFVNILEFQLALGGALGGSWVAGLGLEILPKTIAFTPLNLSPIGLTQPPFVKFFGWDLVPLKHRDSLKQPDVSHILERTVVPKVETESLQ